MEIIKNPPKLAGTVYDDDNKLIGRYIYLTPEHQDKLDSFCNSWLETYASNQDFFLTIDLETTGLKPHEGDILLVSISWDGRNSIVFSPHGFDLVAFKNVLNTIPLNNHNIKFDLKWLGYHYGTESIIYMDTLVAAQCGWAGYINALQGGFALDNLVKLLLSGYNVTKAVRKEFIGMKLSDGFTMEQIEYAAKDSLLTHQLAWPITKRLLNQGLWDVWEEIEKPLISIMVKTELQGVKIDTDRVTKLLTEKEAEIASVYANIKSELNTLPANKQPVFPKNEFNPGSSAQIITALAAFGVSITNTTKETLQSTQAEVNLPFLGYVIEWRKIKGIISKFLIQWLEKHIDPETNCIFPSFNTYGGETGRLSCREPNMQQIPPSLRSMIIPRSGRKILSLDYSQFELRAAAGLSGEQYLLDAFAEREELLPKIKEIARRYNYVDPDSFVKAVGKKLVTPSPDEDVIITQFTLTDIHKRNAALILGKKVVDVESKDREIGKCVSLDSYIHTNKGIRTLRSLLPKKPKKDTFYEVKDLKVLTDEGYRPCPKVYYQGKSKALRVVTGSGRSLVCSKVHQFRTVDNKGNYVWIQAGKLKPGMPVFLKMGGEFEGKHTKYPLNFTTQAQWQALCEFLGLVLRHGSVASKTIILPGGLDTKARALLQAMGFTKTKINGPTKAVNSIIIFREELAEWIGTVPTLPRDVLEALTPKTILSLFTGLTTNSSMFRFDMDPAILQQLQNILLRVGINSFYSKGLLQIQGHNTTAFSNFLQGKPIPKLSFVKRLKLASSVKIHQKIIEEGFFGEELSLTDEEVEKILTARLTPIEYSTALNLSNMNLRKDIVAAILPAEDELGDCTVPDNHTVVYEGFVTHNTLGYAVLYGAGPKRIQDALAAAGFYHDLSTCKQFLEQFFIQLPKIKEFIQYTHSQVDSPGYIATTMGRRRFFDLPPKYQTRLYQSKLEEAYRESTNFCFQGANADATKMAAVLMDTAFKSYPEEVRPMLLLTVHDEIVIEVHKSNIDEVAPMSEQIMIDCGARSINHSAPIETSLSIGDYWTK